ncbi:MAG: hypothetical protein WCV50_03960 [Patescibacteria group bacterium]
MEEKNPQPEEEAAVAIEAPQRELQPNDIKTGSSLYDINETESGFEVNLPGLIHEQREAIFGTTKKAFATRMEAEQAVELAKERTKETFERMSLKKTFTASFYRIDDTPDGKYRVTLPGLVHSRTGYFVGTTCRDFDTWQQAKEYYLQSRENNEQLTHNPLLEIQASDDEKIAFSDLDAFNPHVAPSKTSHPIPPAVEKYITQKEKLAGEVPGTATYQATVKEKDWDKHLYAFISEYLGQEGAELSKQLNIEHLDGLTPKQAIELATQLVIDLTKYNETRSDKSTESQEKTREDQNTTVQLLSEGLKKRGDVEWNGNGVCRNFASMVKAVFEALKANQTSFNRLRDTYCTFESGREEFAPKRKKQGSLEMGGEGHAWNTFVTVSREGGANATTVDATWAKRNLETKGIENLDYTLTRMEPIVQRMAQELSATSPHKEEQLRHILSFYQLAIEKPNQTGNLVSPGEVRQFFASRALQVMVRQGVPGELPQPFAEAIGQEYAKIANDADISEIETLYKISRNHPEINFHQILREYLKDKTLSEHHAPIMIFADGNLQSLVYDELKQRPDFENFFKESPRFRVRMREVIPQLFAGFLPWAKPEDALEMRHLFKESSHLRNYEILIPRNPSEENIKSLFDKARETLRTANPARYDEVAGGLDDYQMIKRFDRLYGELKL